MLSGVALLSFAIGEIIFRKVVLPGPTLLHLAPVTSRHRPAENQAGLENP
jgi:hypothetical protein